SRPQPDGHMARLDGALYDADKFSLDPVEVDRVAKTGAERRDGDLRVVAAAVKASVDSPLHPAAQWREERDRSKRRRRYTARPRQWQRPRAEGDQADVDTNEQTGDDRVG